MLFCWCTPSRPILPPAQARSAMLWARSQLLSSQLQVGTQILKPTNAIQMLHSQSLTWHHSPGSHVLKPRSFFSAMAKSGKSLLKEPCLCPPLANRTHSRKCLYQTMLDSVLLSILSFLDFTWILLHHFGTPAVARNHLFVSTAQFQAARLA